MTRGDNVSNKEILNGTITLSDIKQAENMDISHIVKMKNDIAGKMYNDNIKVLRNIVKELESITKDQLYDFTNMSEKVPVNNGKIGTTEYELCYKKPSPRDCTDWLTEQLHYLYFNSASQYITRAQYYTVKGQIQCLGKSFDSRCYAIAFLKRYIPNIEKRYEDYIKSDIPYYNIQYECKVPIVDFEINVDEGNITPIY